MRDQAGRMSQGRRHVEAGFTILEVLVAFVVASLLLTVVLGGFSSGLAGLLRVERFGTAAMVARSRLAEAGIVTPVVPGSYSGEEEGDITYHWEVEVEPFKWGYAEDLAGAGGVLYRVDVSVSWDSGGRPQLFHLTTLRVSRELMQ